MIHRRVSDPKGERKYLIVGSKAWNERFLEYEWNGHEFGDKRGRPLPESISTVEKRRRNKFFARFDRKVAEGRLSDMINSSLGYALTYYHTVEGDMYKDWVKVKRTKKDFRLNNDDDNRLWVRLPDKKSEEEVEPINLIFDETDEFSEIVKTSSSKVCASTTSASSQSWHTTSCKQMPEIPRSSVSSMIDWDTSASYTENALMNGSMSIESGTEMP